MTTGVLTEQGYALLVWQPEQPLTPTGLVGIGEFLQLLNIAASAFERASKPDLGNLRRNPAGVIEQQRVRDEINVGLLHYGSPFLTILESTGVGGATLIAFFAARGPAILREWARIRAEHQAEIAEQRARELEAEADAEDARVRVAKAQLDALRWEVAAKVIEVMEENLENRLDERDRELVRQAVQRRLRSRDERLMPPLQAIETGALEELRQRAQLGQWFDASWED